MSPREYAAKIDLLRVQDCLAARMKPCEIARHLGKDKAWVSRTIRKLLAEKATAYASISERATLEEMRRDFDRLISTAMELGETGSDKAKLAAIQAAGIVLRAKQDFLVKTGQIQIRDAHTDPPANFIKTSQARLNDTGGSMDVDALLIAIADRIRAARGNENLQELSPPPLFPKF